MGRARRVIFLVWTSSILSALPWAVYAKVNYIKYAGDDLLESAWCGMPFHEETLNMAPLYLIIASTLIYFIIPFSIVFVLYLRCVVSLFPSIKLAFRIGFAMKENRLQQYDESSKESQSRCLARQ